MTVNKKEKRGICTEGVIFTLDRNLDNCGYKRHSILFRRRRRCSFLLLLPRFLMHTYRYTRAGGYLLMIYPSFIDDDTDDARKIRDRTAKKLAIYRRTLSNFHFHNAIYARRTFTRVY